MKKNLFHQRMVDSVNKLQFDDQKYQTNGTVRDESYKGNLLFPMKDFVSFKTDRQLIFMSTRFLKDKFYGLYVPQVQLAYIFGTTYMGTCMVPCVEETNICDISSILVGMKQKLHQIKSISVFYAVNYVVMCSNIRGTLRDVCSLMWGLGGNAQWGGEEGEGLFLPCLPHPRLVRVITIKLSIFSTYEMYSFPKVSNLVQENAYTPEDHH